MGTELERFPVPYIEQHRVWDNDFQFKIHDFQAESWFGLKPWMKLHNCTLDRARTMKNTWNTPLRDLLHKGAKVMDCGANAGYITMCMAKYVGPTGQVIAFEPDDYNIFKIRENLVLNSITNVQVEPVALGSEQKVSWLRHETINKEPPGSPVLTTTLDSYLTFGVDAIKVDVEGMEIELLRGAKETLRRFHPLMEIEVHTNGPGGVDFREHGYTTQELWDILRSNDYTMFVDGKEIGWAEFENHCGAVYCHANPF